MGNKNGNSFDLTNVPCDDIGSFASGLSAMAPAQFTVLATLVGVLITERLDLDQQNALGNFIVSVGQTILTAAAQGQSLQSDSNDVDMQKLIKGMKMQLDALENKSNQNRNKR